MNKYIVLIEDNPDDVFLFKLALKQLEIKFPIMVLNNGEDALWYCQKLERKVQNPPGVIFLDINIPRLSGLQILKKLRINKILKQCPIVVFTSSDYTSDIDMSYEAGAGFYFKKPNNINDLKRKISRVLSYLVVT